MEWVASPARYLNAWRSMDSATVFCLLNQEIIAKCIELCYNFVTIIIMEICYLTQFKSNLTKCGDEVGVILGVLILMKPVTQPTLGFGCVSLFA